MIPINASSFVVYILPCKKEYLYSSFSLENETRGGMEIGAYGFPKEWEKTISDPELYALFVKYIRGMGSSVIFVITFLDKDIGYRFYPGQCWK